MIGTTEAMKEALRRAVKESRHVCEDCGQPGVLRTGCWVAVRCVECDRRRKERIAERPGQISGGAVEQKGRWV